MSKDKNNALFYIGDEQWELREDDKILKQYPTKDLRMTIVYRARCFESKKTFEEFNKRNPKAASVKPP